MKANIAFVCFSFSSFNPHNSNTLSNTYFTSTDILTFHLPCLRHQHPLISYLSATVVQCQHWMRHMIAIHQTLPFVRGRGGYTRLGHPILIRSVLYITYIIYAHVRGFIWKNPTWKQSKLEQFYLPSFFYNTTTFSVSQIKTDVINIQWSVKNSVEDSMHYIHLRRGGY